MFQVTADGTSKLLSVELPADPSRASLTNETIQLVADAMVAFAHSCLFLRTQLLDLTVSAMLDCGASENFMALDLVRTLGYQMHHLRKPLVVRIADGSRMSCEMFVRARVRIGTWRTRLSFYVFPSRIPIMFGIPFLSRYNPRIDWRERTLIIEDKTGTHLLRADPPRALPYGCPPVSVAETIPATFPCVSPLCLLAETLQIVPLPPDVPLVDPTPADLEGIADLPHPENPRDGYGKLKTADPPLAEIAFPEVRAIVERFADVFPAELPLGLPPSRPTDHRIDLAEGARPPSHRIYRLCPAELAQLKKQLAEYLKAGQIEPARSPYGAGVLFAKKKDGTLRMCIDYRGLNAQTIKDKYPLPRIDEILDNLQGGSFFTKLDLAQGYHQLRMHPEHVGRTAFQTQFGSYQFRVMPFGLCNAPATFQRTLNDLLAPFRGICAVYIDDIIIFSRTLAEHCQHLELVLSALRKEQLYAKRKKCFFAQRTLEFCGFIVGGNGIKTHPDKIAAVRTWPQPGTVKDVRSFLGLCGFYQKFVPHYADLATPLTNLLRKEVPWVWSTSADMASRPEGGIMRFSRTGLP